MVICLWSTLSEFFCLMRVFCTIIQGKLHQVDLRLGRRNHGVVGRWERPADEIFLGGH